MKETLLDSQWAVALECARYPWKKTSLRFSLKAPPIEGDTSALRRGRTVPQVAVSLIFTYRLVVKDESYYNFIISTCKGVLYIDRWRSALGPCVGKNRLASIRLPVVPQSSSTVPLTFVVISRPSFVKVRWNTARLGLHKLTIVAQQLSFAISRNQSLTLRDPSIWPEMHSPGLTISPPPDVYILTRGWSIGAC